MTRSRIALLSAAAFVAAAVSVHSYMLDGLDGWFFIGGESFPDDTKYSAGYTDAAFRRVGRSMTESDVRRLLGEPISEIWFYTNDTKVHIERERVTAAYGPNARSLPIKDDMHAAQVVTAMGLPWGKRWLYSRAANGGSYRKRIVAFKAGRVADKIHSYYID